MKRLHTLIAISLMSACVFQARAQLKELVNEAFSNNNRQWEVSDTRILTNGTYQVRAGEDIEQSTVSFFVDQQKDFDVLAAVAMVDGTEESGYGLGWLTGADMYNLFLISPDGEYLIHSGKLDQLKGWKATTAIKPAGENNQLRIERRGDRLSFYINDKKLEDRKNFPFFGAYSGFVVLPNTAMAADNFIFRQDQTIMLSDEASKFQKRENLGPDLNSIHDDLGPLIAVDGKTIYFARQFVTENVGGKDDSEDVWASHWLDERWGPARNLGHALNTPQPDNLVAVSSDNNTFIFEEPDGLKARHRSENGWSPLEKLDFVVRNEADHFVACLSVDGKALLFSARLKSNVYYDQKKDESDLYVSFRKGHNSWSAPVNLGSKINSAGEDTSPFLAADGKSLYFASNGRPGYGDQDIFVATRNGDSWTDWSEPKNLGPAINTPAFDAYFTVPASGDYAYFVSYGEGFGGGDIFRIKLHDEAKPSPVVLVKGKVLSNATKKPLKATIHFESLVGGVEMGEARSDPATGSYQIVLPFGTNYGLKAKVEGYYAVHENMDLLKTDKYREVEHDILMVPIEVGETIKLNNIFFEPGSAVLKSESFPELDHLVGVLKDNATMIIELGGHTDNIGNVEVLMKLSEGRVVSVRDYIVSHGIDGARITGKGYGASKPLAPSDTEENRKLNRRVEFKIVKK